MYTHFEIAAYSVSFTAFYFYARRIRTAATLAELRSPSHNPDSKTHQLLPDILAENLLDAALDVEHASSHKIARLARAYRVTQLALASRESHQAALVEAKRRADREETASILDHADRLKKLNREIVDDKMQRIDAAHKSLDKMEESNDSARDN